MAKSAALPSRIACLMPRAVATELALDALADVAAGFSPLVERAADAIFLEVGDLGRLYASEDEIAKSLLGNAGEVGVEALVAIASDKGVARVLARSLRSAASSGCKLIVPRGHERLTLAALPLAVLAAPPPLQIRLDSWGLRTVGDLAALPRPAVVTRLGSASAALHRLAGGESSEPLQPTAPPAEIREEQSLLDQFDREIENLEPLLFVLRGLLDRLLLRLRARSQACGDLHLCLSLTSRADDIRRIAVATPTQKLAPLLDLLRVSLESQPPQAAIEKLALWTKPSRSRPVQMDLFAPAGPAPEKLSTTLARLDALCGSGRVGRPVLCDSHAPGAAALSPFALSERAPLPGALPLAPALILAARVVRPPCSVSVVRCEGALRSVKVHEPTGRDKQNERAVRRVGGPYRLRDVRATRDYYDVELCDGDLLRLFHHLDADRWFLDAVYD